MELIVVRNGRERPIIDRCRVCKAPFFEGESRTRIERHVVDCLAANHDRLMAERAQQHPEVMKPWDPELASWMQDPVRAERIMRGEIKP